MVLLNIAGLLDLWEWIGRPKPGGHGGFQWGNAGKRKMLEQCPAQLDEKPRVSFRDACGAESFSFVTFLANHAKLVNYFSRNEDSEEMLTNSLQSVLSQG